MGYSLDVHGINWDDFFMNFHGDFHGDVSMGSSWGSVILWIVIVGGFMVA